MVAVESVDTAVFQRDFVFQLCYLSEDDDQYVLYIAAPTAQDREQWLDYIRKRKCPGVFRHTSHFETIILANKKISAEGEQENLIHKNAHENES